MTKFHARVHPILARNSDMGIIIRRGPAKYVCTIGWDRKSDTFQLGQWLHGQIYERRCDLSPDGSHFIYFAANHKPQHELGGTWTAISRTPYLKSVGLWTSRSEVNGGGLFITDSVYWLNKFWLRHEALQSPENMKEQEEFPFHEKYGSRCRGVYYIRLQRDGWKLVLQATGSYSHDVFEKPLLNGWILEKTAHTTSNPPEGAGCYYDTHRIMKRHQDVILDCPEWEWADVDRNRLVWIDKGVLYASEVGFKGLVDVRKLFDFTPLKFKPTAAPY